MENEYQNQDWEKQRSENLLKLDYSDLAIGDSANHNYWEKILSNSTDEVSYDQLREAVANGLDRSIRGEIWHHLVSFRQSQELGYDIPEVPNTNADYGELKSQLTSHQHAILIDLGRTFPNHGYFSGDLGPGQCGLFNILKAYSILDPEVGYCQGLPFCVGMLLMHTDEESAFSLLKHLMFNEGYRKYFKPDMSGLQVSLYQFTRLLAEVYPKVYKKLDQLEVDPSLYATPWFLTVYASCFPLGFVARVFDLILLDGLDAIIKVAVCLMAECEKMILKCTSFEEVVTVLGKSLPLLEPKRLDDVIRRAIGLNLSKQLHSYEVEYKVLQEEHRKNRNDIERLETIIDTKSNEIMKKENELATKDRAIVCLTQQVAEKDLRIDELKKKLQILKKIKFNNNRGLEEKYNRVLQLLEDLKEEAPDSVR